MAKIIVTETFTRTYELEVPDTDEETITNAIDGFNETEGPEPAWVCTVVTDEAGKELMDF